MNLYSKKQWWKILLFVMAMLIAGGFLWYNSILVDSWQKEERKKVKQWSQAVKKKADLLNLINQSFDQLREKERKQISLWVKAQQEILTPSENNFGFVLQILNATRQSIPSILTDQDDKILRVNNIDFMDEFVENQKQSDPGKSDFYYEKKAISDAQDTLQKCIEEWQKKYPPFEFVYFETSSQKIYYTDSKLFEQLQFKRDSLIESFNKDIEKSLLVPVIFTDSSGTNVFASSFPEKEINDTSFVIEKLAEMKIENEPIPINLGQEEKGYIYYQDSLMLKQLKYYPYIQFSIVGAFLIIAYLIFSTFRKAEQNQVWVGMAKETAHQLGTPLSSLLAWMELLKDKVADEKLLDEMNKDIQRLEIITERFSKIGSESALKKENTSQVIQKAIEYLSPRVSKKVQIKVNPIESDILANINIPLFEWVIENLTKNAIDAMEGKGELTFNISSEGRKVFIDITDTGKGIAGNKFKTVFEPGFTTKKRGWGLGLSLVKRIIENYHKGKIFVKQSELGKGTTFRIVLKK